MPNQLPLLAFWGALGANFDSEAGWILPSFFSSVEEEYHAATQALAVFDLSFRGKIKVTGADRVNFLHSILTNDIKSLKSGAGCPAALLSATGKMLAYMHVHAFEEFLLLDFEPGYEETFTALLDKYLISEEVQFKTVSGEWVHLRVHGKTLENILLPAGRLLSKSNHEADLLFEPGQAQEAVKNLLKTSLLHPAKPAGLLCAEILRMEAGKPRFGLDMNENVTLSEAGLDEIAASETKGCYPGQEVVARTKTYQGLKKKLTGFFLEDHVLVKKASKVFDREKNEIGWITSSCFSPGLRTVIALGYAAKGFFETSQPIFIENAGKLLPGKTHPLPFRGPGF